VTNQPAVRTETFVLLGTVSRPHGIRGDLKVRPFTENPGNFSHYRRLYLSADGGTTKEPYTNLLGKVNGNTVILKLAECTTRDQAEQLTGRQIWLASNDLLPIGKDEFYLFTLEGKQAHTTTGRILGLVSKIMSSSGQDILVIREGQAEYLVPVVREFIMAIDDNKIVLDLPPGLLEINS
jgi:16S rRNA processing protein RimM